jgi:hypothetical protein
MERRAAQREEPLAEGEGVAKMVVVAVKVVVAEAAPQQTAL